MRDAYCTAWCYIPPFPQKHLTVIPTLPVSPIQEVASERLCSRGVRLWVKRDDLLHHEISGNKWRKLKYNLAQARLLNCSSLITFGGAYSNHLAAVAAAGKAYGFATHGIVRGECLFPLNPTLHFADNCGMTLHFLNRTAYRETDSACLLANLGIDSTDAFVIPSGGANEFGLRGCVEIVGEVSAQLDCLPDYWVTACGTGTTLAGLITGLNSREKALGISVLKGGFLATEVRNHLDLIGQADLTNWEVIEGFHVGGYAKFDSSLIEFINGFHAETGIPLDPIYTGKACAAIHQLAESGYFGSGKTVLFLHTGGLQGIAGFNQRFGNLIR
jgi:1-aminocyclopropane-1-carboxylate deaminase